MQETQLQYSVHLIRVSNDDIHKFQSMLQSAAELLQYCANCVSSGDVQPHLRAIRQNNTTLLLRRVNVHILQHDTRILAIDVDIINTVHIIANS